MASIDFLQPPNFPSPTIDDFDQGFIDPWEENEYSGVLVRRRILTNVRQQIKFSVKCSETQRQNMLVFMYVTTNGGSADFNWWDPRSQLEIDAKFATLPNFTHLRAVGDDNISWIKQGKEWTCNIQLIQTG